MSKGLKALYSGIEVNTKDYGNCTAYTPDCIDIIEKELKALDIIKKCRIKLEKREDFDVVSYATFRKNGKYRYYINDIEIAQEKFELLKEVIENE